MLEPIDEIKSRLDIIQVVREYLPNLKQAGANWKALCPFHTEKTPSFMVSPERQIWYCFGSCGEGGDIFKFVMKHEGVEFPEALRILAKKAGVVLKSQDPKTINKKTRLLDVCETAANYWHNILLDSPAPQQAREYLKKRGLAPETIEDFKLGYSLDSWDALSKYLRNKNFNQDEIIASGLVVEKPQQGPGFKKNYYDRFRGRIMFPIKDVHGNIVGFTARLLDEKQEGGKYINTPQTLIYDKSRVIYGLDKAKKEIREKNLAVVVEGNMDVITSHQAGIANVVASSGTALTRDQLRLLKRYSANLAICFDMDVAGESASERGIDLALQEGMSIKVVQIPSDAGKDPDDCLRASEGKKIWAQAINQAKSILDYYFEKTLAKYDIIKVEGKKKVAKVLLGIIVKIADPIEQAHYLQKLGEILGVSEQILREALPKIKIISSREPQAVQPTTLVTKDRNLLLSERLLSLAIKFPENLEYIIDHLTPEVIDKPEFQKLYKNLIIYYNDHISNISTSARPKDIFDYNEFKKMLGDKADQIDKLVLLAEKDFLDFDEDQIRIEVLENIKLLRQDHIKRELKKMEEDMKRAEQKGDQNRIDDLSLKFNSLTEQLDELK